MKKQRSRAPSYKKFDVKYLDQLAQDEASCVYVHTLPHHLALHPFHLNDMNSSVKDLLGQEIAKYSAKLEGILFGYKNIKFLSKLGAICGDSCFVHVDIEADFFIFKPEVGKTLQGVVKQTSNDNVGCLVHKIFNVALPRPKHSENWLGYSTSPGSEILFTITHTNFKGKLPYIRGEIVSILSNPVQDDSQANAKEKKGKNGTNLIFDVQDDSQLDGGKEYKTTTKKAKHATKTIFEDIEGIEEVSKPKRSKKRKNSITEEDVVEKVPKKKRKKSKSYDEELV